jgi:hypothetical protein
MFGTQYQEGALNMILRALLVTVLTAVLSSGIPSARAQAPTPSAIESEFFLVLNTQLLWRL